MTTGAERTYFGLERVDWLSVLVFAALVLLGWLNIYAAVAGDGAEGFSLSSKYGSQLVWMGISFAAALVILLIDDIYYHVFAYPVYWIMLALLVLTLFLSPEINGARSWLRLGPVSFQPAEFMKFAAALALARCMSAYNFSLRSGRGMFTVALILLLPMGIIALQNDMGSAVVYVSFLLVLYREGMNGWILFALVLAAAVFVLAMLLSKAALVALIFLFFVLLEGFMNGGWKRKAVYVAAVALAALAVFYLLNLAFGPGAVDMYWCLAGAVLLSLGAAAVYGYRRRLRSVFLCMALMAGSLVYAGSVDYAFDKLLQVHQQKRVLDLLGIESDLQKWGYNVNQSMIAIGSGGFSGKGFLKGTQTKYDFVPEQHTDFIFCTVGEEWGFIGSAAVLGLFGLLIVRLMRMGERQKEPFGRVYCYGVAGVFLFHLAVNVGMTVGIVPVIGIPLPLFSYGGSSLLAFTAMFFVAVKLDAKKRGPLLDGTDQPL